MATSGCSKDQTDTTATDDAAARERRTRLNRRIFECLVQGEKHRGTAGIAFVRLRDDVVEYMLTSELEQEAFREAVEDTLTEEGSDYMFVVEQNDAGQLNLWKVPRRDVASFEFEMAQREVVANVQQALQQAG